MKTNMICDFDSAIQAMKLGEKLYPVNGKGDPVLATIKWFTFDRGEFVCDNNYAKYFSELATYRLWKFFDTEKEIIKKSLIHFLEDSGEIKSNRIKVLVDELLENFDIFKKLNQPYLKDYDEATK